MPLFHKVMPIVYKSIPYLHFWNLTKPIQKFKLSHWLKKQQQRLIFDMGRLGRVRL